MNKKLLFLIGGGILLLILLVPVRQNRVVSYGVDAYSAHRPLFGNRTVTQELTLEDTTLGIGAIFVDLRRSNRLTDVTVEVIDTATHQTIIKKTIPKESIKDDTFAYANFKDTPISSDHTVQFVFSAPEATNQNPIGLRFDPKDDSLALSLSERVPLWKFAITTIQNAGDTWRYMAIAMIASFIVSLSVFLRPTKKQWLLAIAVVAIAAFLIRAVLVPQFGGVSGGDAYNYLSISDAMSESQNPFANTKRLPGYPLILTPFYVSGMFDDQQVMRYVQIVSSIIAVFFLVGITRALSLPWPTALLASVIVAFQKDYYWTSLRPEPYSLYTAFLLTSLFFFLRSYATKKIWIYITFGLSLGYGAMVRQEGFLLAALLGLCSLTYEIYTIYTEKTWRPSFQRLLWMYIPALCLVLPFFIHNTLTYGHPLYTEYLEGDRLQIVDSYLAFQDAVGATWGVIGSMWKSSWDTLERIDMTNPIFIVSMLVLLGWYGFLRYLKHTSSTRLLTFALGALWIVLILSSTYIKHETIATITVVTAAWVLASVPLFLIETKWRGLVVLIVLISQLGIATWFHPFPKHYQQSYPIIALMIATALISRIPLQKKGLTATILATTTLPFFIVAVSLYPKINTEIDRYNANVALDSVSYRAAKAARTLPTPIGFDQAYLPARLYFDPNAKYFPDEDTPTLAMEEKWLQENPVKTMVVTNGNNVFKTIPSTWKKVQEFKAAGRDEEILVSTIYSLP